MALLSGSGSLDLLGWNGGSKPLPVMVKNSEGSKEYKGGDGAFTVKLSLSPGINTIEYGGRTVRVFLAGTQEKAPAVFSPPDPHAVDNACEDCHALAAGAAPLQESPPGLCGRCHDDMLKNKNGKLHAAQHPPAEEGDCLACHPFHQRSIKSLPAEAKRALCFGSRRLHRRRQETDAQPRRQGRMYGLPQPPRRVVEEPAAGGGGRVRGERMLRGRQLHARGPEIEHKQDFVEAHKWLSLARRSGCSEANPVLREIELFMTPKQISQSQMQVEEWKVKAGTQPPPRPAQPSP